MTAHTHTERVDGCFRCELGRDEAEAAMEREITDLEAEIVQVRSQLRHALDEHCGCLSDRWCEDDNQPMNDCTLPVARCLR